MVCQVSAELCRNKVQVWFIYVSLSCFEFLQFPPVSPLSPLRKPPPPPKKKKKIGKNFGKIFSQVFTSCLENISDPAKFVPGFLLNFNVYQEQTLPDQKYFQGNL